MKIGQKLILGFLSIVLIVGVFVKIAFNDLEKMPGNVALRELARIKGMFGAIKAHETETMESILDILAPDKDLRDKFLSKDREKLFEFARPIFRSLKERHDITHFYFILPDGQCFLRVHNKDLYGDQIARPTYLKAANSGKMASGIELGKTAFALRVVAPYYAGSELVGYLELGKEIDRLLNRIEEETGYKYVVVADKKYLDKKDWLSMISLKGSRDNWDDLAGDAIVYASSDKTLRGNVNEKSIRSIEDGQDMLESYKEDGRSFQLGGFSIKNEDGTRLGTVFVAIDSTESEDILRHTGNLLFGMMIFAIIGILAIGLFFSSSISLPLNSLKDDLLKVSGGDLDTVSEVDRKDEIGELAVSFNKMTSAIKRLTVSKDYMEGVLRSMIDGLIVVDQEAKIGSVNKAICQLLGYKAEELIGRDLSILFPGEEIPIEVAQLQIMLEGSSLKDYETSYISKDGKVVPIILSGSVLTSIDCQMGGQKEDCQSFKEKGKHCEKMIGAVYVAKDIAGLREFEHIVRDKESRLRLALESANMGSWQWSLIENRRYFDKQTCAILGIDPSKFSGSEEEFFGRVHPDDRDMLKIKLAETVKKDALYDPEYRVLWSDGSIHYIASRGRLDYDNKGRPLAINGIVWDITELKRSEDRSRQELNEVARSRKILTSMLEDNNEARDKLEAKLKEVKEIQFMLIQSEKLASLGRLVSEMAHEVNNPLMIISGNAQISLMDASIGGELKANLSIIHDECVRAKGILDRLLTFAKPSKGEMKRLNINSHIEHVIKLLEHAFGVCNVKIKTYFAERLPLVSMDEKQVEEVFMNLFNNARDAMPDGGEITVRTSLDGERVKIEIIDSGVGMEENVASRISEPFYTTKEKGTGLGIPVCYGIIKAHNGELKFTSELGKGTTVTILLPANG